MDMVVNDIYLERYPNASNAQTIQVPYRARANTKKGCCCCGCSRQGLQSTCPLLGPPAQPGPGHQHARPEPERYGGHTLALHAPPRLTLRRLGRSPPSLCAPAAHVMPALQTLTASWRSRASSSARATSSLTCALVRVTCRPPRLGRSHTDERTGGARFGVSSSLLQVPQVRVRSAGHGRPRPCGRARSLRLVQHDPQPQPRLQPLQVRGQAGGAPSRDAR